MIYREEDIIYNNLLYINEEKVLTEEDYRKDYKSFDEFCKHFDSIENVMYWYKYNNIKWPKYEEDEDPNDSPFCWPDDIIKNKVGNCYDHALFFYYFCRRKNIDARIYRYAIYAEPLYINEYNKYWCMGHMVCLCKLNSGIYVCNYGENPHNNLYGPFSSYEDCSKSYSKYYNDMIMKCLKNMGHYMKIKEFSKVYYGYLDNYGIRLHDKFYGNHEISQNYMFNKNKSVLFNYDRKSINKNIIDNVLGKLRYNIRLFFNKINNII